MTRGHSNNILGRFVKIVFGYSKTRHEVFTLPKQLAKRTAPKVKLNTNLCRWDELTCENWRQLRKFQGRFTSLYLKWRYGSPATYILLSYIDKTLAHVEWIVPAKVIRARYPFVTENSYAIISCLTLPRYRGLGIYPSQIQKVVESDISAEAFWIWTAPTNGPSLKGIRKAGGVKIGRFIRTKWFWGCISHMRDLPEISLKNHYKIDRLSNGRRK